MRLATVEAVAKRLSKGPATRFQLIADTKLNESSVDRALYVLRLEEHPALGNLQRLRARHAVRRERIRYPVRQPMVPKAATLLEQAWMGRL